MKVLIAFITISCLQLVFGDCPDCDGQSNFYNAVGCTVLCRRKGCPTNYNCQKQLSKYKAEQKCFFNGTYYDVDTTLPERYPGRYDGLLCFYQCFNDSNSYYFSEISCDANPNVPTEEQCNMMLQLIGGYILQFITAIAYTPAVCQLDVIRSDDLPLSNCVGSKCCRFFDRFYKKGTTVAAFGAVCFCSCPPVMNCKYTV